MELEMQNYDYAQCLLLSPGNAITLTSSAMHNTKHPYPAATNAVKIMNSQKPTTRPDSHIERIS
eukprot:scaffold5984_cov437-Ochromonas_danica.AAC.1